MDLRTVDISAADDVTASRVVEAAKMLGFVYITGHGIPREVLQQVWRVSEQLFALPEEEKRKYAIASDNRGWSRPGTETLDPANQVGADFKEAWNLSIERDPVRPVPQLLKDCDHDLAAFKDGCTAVVQKLCLLFGMGLSLQDENFFCSRHNADRTSGTTLRLLYYPQLDRDLLPGEQRAGAHTDYGSMTLLFQKPGQSGLEISTGNDWLAVPPPLTDSDDELPILVNIADQLQLWTSGVLKSTLHRVTSSYKGDRYSIAYFAHPDDDTVLEPVIGAHTLTSSPPLTAGEHLRARIAGTYVYDRQS